MMTTMLSMMMMMMMIHWNVSMMNLMTMNTMMIMNHSWLLAVQKTRLIRDYLSSFHWPILLLPLLFFEKFHHQILFANSVKFVFVVD